MADGSEIAPANDEAYTETTGAPDTDAGAGGLIVPQQICFDGKPSLNSGRLLGKTAVVFGGAQGLGEAISQTFAAQGASVLIADINLAAARTVASDTPGGMAIQVDVRLPDSVAGVIEKATKAVGGRLDIVVNCAGMVSPLLAPLAKHDSESFKKVVDVNLNGGFYVMASSLKQMKEQESGVVLQMLSTAAHSGVSFIAPYTASKWGLRGLIQEAAVEYAPHGIRVLGLSPTTVLTPMVQNLVKENPALGANLGSHSKLPYLPEAKDVANAALFLCSDEARFVTGSSLQLDGGLLAAPPMNVSPSDAVDVVAPAASASPAPLPTGVTQKLLEDLETWNCERMLKFDDGDLDAYMEPALGLDDLTVEVVIHGARPPALEIAPEKLAGTDFKTVADMYRSIFEGIHAGYVGRGIIGIHRMLKATVTVDDCKTDDKDKDDQDNKPAAGSPQKDKSFLSAADATDGPIITLKVPWIFWEKPKDGEDGSDKDAEKSWKTSGYSTVAWKKLPGRDGSDARADWRIWKYAVMVETTSDDWAKTTGAKIVDEDK